MNARKLFGLIVFLVFLTVALASVTSAQGPKPRGPLQSGSPTVVSYQGHFTVNGSSYNGTGYFKFAVVDSGNTTYWSNDGTSTGGGAPTNAVPQTVNYGLFNVLLGDTTLTNMTQPMSASVFNGTDRYLRVWFSSSSSGPFTLLSPDQRFASVPYALQAVEAMKNWDLSGNSGTVDGTNFVGTTDSVPLTLRVNNVVGWRLAPSGTNTPNVIGGYSGNTVDSGFYGATIGGGGANGLINRVSGNYATVGGGVDNTASNDYATISGGGTNTARAFGATVGGGEDNTASYTYATVGGGATNTASREFATVGGGSTNTASNQYAVVGGGIQNTASGIGAFVGGGGYDGLNRLGNLASGNASTISGGISNTVALDANYGTIGGGNSNTAGNYAATVGGGYRNAAGYEYATVGGGSKNNASAYATTISGGMQNTASYDYATVGGGYWNTASDMYATVSGGGVNQASKLYATVGGGYSNTASGIGAFVGGGGSDGTILHGNVAQGKASTVSGGISNTITSSASWATIGGGITNTISNNYGFIGGGSQNTAGNQYTVVGGGTSNIASGAGAFVGGGGYDGGSTVVGNKAQGPASTVCGGIGNTVTTGSGYATVAGGIYNTAGNFGAFVGGGGFDGSNVGGNKAQGAASTIGAGISNTASGDYATIPGGANNTASGTASFAAGQHANTNNKSGAFVWGDNSTSNDVLAPANNSFIVRASGGITMYTNSGLSSGAVLYAGSGSWNNLSDKNLKANFAPVDVRAILARVNALPITTWNYTTQDATTRHIGPMAQDFAAAFRVGENDTTISTVDANGVALAAIQGLYQVVQDKDAKIAAQQKQIDDLNARLTALENGTVAAQSPLVGLANNAWLVGVLLVAVVFYRGRR